MRLAAILMAAMATGAAAQVPQATEAKAKAEAVSPRAVALEVARQVDRLYVVDAVRPKLVTMLRANAAAGRYDGLDPAALADKLNGDMGSVAHDKHLSINWSPQQAAMIGPWQPDNGDVGPEAARFMARMNHGVTELKRLDGNIRYMSYDGFAWTGPDSAAAIETAMRFLSGGDAAVIDLRRNGGGDPRAVAAMASYFLPPNTPLARFEMRGRTEPDNRTGPVALSLRGKPVYVLISGRSASAAEEFATHVSAFGFGTLVGEATAGAAYRNDLMGLPGGYVLSVSVGRPVHARTGGDWEGVGVKPAIAVEPDGALDRALAEAHARLGKGKAPEAAEHARLGRFFAAKLSPATPALALGSYAGRYGVRQVRVAGDHLVFQRDGGPETPLVAIAPDRFAMERDPTTEVRFETANGVVTGVVVERLDGRVDRAARG